MKRYARAVVAAALAAVASGAAGAPAATPGDPGRERCEPAHVVRFPTGSADLDLDAQSELARAKNWVVLARGRYLRVLAPPDRTIEQIGLVRADEVVAYLLELGVSSRAVVMGDFSSLGGARRHAIGRNPVVVLHCFGVPAERRPGWLWWAPYVLDPDEFRPERPADVAPPAAEPPAAPPPTPEAPPTMTPPAMPTTPPTTLPTTPPTNLPTTPTTPPTTPATPPTNLPPAPAPASAPPPSTTAPAPAPPPAPR